MFFDVYEKLCKERGLTPTGASAAIGFSKGSVSYWRKKYKEGVDAGPDTKTAALIADFFGVSVDYLFGRTDDPGISSKDPSNDPATDVLDDVDIAFYGDYKELDEDDKETVRDMVRIMRERRAKKQEK